MSLATALSNAISGLGATSRGTQVVSDNLANIKTPGYARRELQQSAVSYDGAGGGVRVDGIARVINSALLSELRSADSAASEANVQTNFFQIIENVIGVPGDAKALSHEMNDFRESLINANAHPNDTVRLANVIYAAKDLVRRLNSASDAVQAERRKADSSIHANIKSLNQGLEQVAQLNRRIAIIDTRGKDPSALVDQRQQVIDQINKIVPIQVAQREASRVAIYTVAGATLLNGIEPVPVAFKPTVYVGNDTAGDVAGGESLYVNNREITDNGMQFFAGGSLSAYFDVRDKLTLQVQQELDSFALELHDRFADPKTDPTVKGDKPGLFTDGSKKADSKNIAGLSARIAINAKLDETETDNLWLLRSGLGAEKPVSAGDTAQIIRFSDAVTKFFPAPEASVFSGESSLLNRLSELESHISTRRVEAEDTSAARNGRVGAISTRFLADGVDTDNELQQLLQYEKAYAANARVIQAVKEMMDEILRF